MTVGVVLGVGAGAGLVGVGTGLTVVGAGLGLGGTGLELAGAGLGLDAGWLLATVGLTAGGTVCLAECEKYGAMLTTPTGKDDDRDGDGETSRKVGDLTDP